MAPRPAIVDLVLTTLSPLGATSARAMFGGYGVSVDGLMVGMVADDALYLKVDGKTRPLWETAGLLPFMYEGKGRPMAMSYHEVPADFFDDPAVMHRWAGLALEAAGRARSGKP